MSLDQPGGSEVCRSGAGSGLPCFAIPSPQYFARFALLCERFAVFSETAAPAPAARVLCSRRDTVNHTGPGQSTVKKRSFIGFAPRFIVRQKCLLLA